MNFDQGSFLTDEEPYEHDDENDPEFIQDLFQDLDQDLQPLNNNGYKIQQRNSIIHDFPNSELHEENFITDFQNPLTVPDLQDQNFFSSGETSDADDTSQSKSLSNSELGDHNFFFDDQISGNSSSGPPCLCNMNFFNSDDPSSIATSNLKNFTFNQQKGENSYNSLPNSTYTPNGALNNSSFQQDNSPDLLGYTFNNWNTASVVPIGINVSYSNQNQFNQNSFFTNTSDFRANQKDQIFDENRRSLMDFNKKDLSNLSLRSRIGGERKKSALSGCQDSVSDEFDRYLKLMVLQNQPNQKVTKKLKIIIFEFFQEYLKSSYPELIEGDLRPLSRNDKRSGPSISNRLLLIKDHVYHNFEHNPKETLVPIVEAYCEYVVKEHKKKGVNMAKTNLDQIQKNKF